MIIEMIIGKTTIIVQYTREKMLKIYLTSKNC